MYNKHCRPLHAGHVPNITGIVARSILETACLTTTAGPLHAGHVSYGIAPLLFTGDAASITTTVASLYTGYALIATCTVACSILETLYVQQALPTRSTLDTFPILLV